MNKIILAASVVLFLAALVGSSVAYYYKNSECCMEPGCFECFLEGEITGCDCDEKIANGELPCEGCRGHGNSGSCARVQTVNASTCSIKIN